MFFPRLRRQAKWMFVFLALVFGVGFVAFGVGSSLPSGVADILSNNSSSTAASVDDAQEKVEKNPNDAEAQLELSRAYQRDGRLDEAAPPLEKYVKLRPKDTGALQELAGLYTTQATRAQEDAALAQLDYQNAAGITVFQSQGTQSLFAPGPLDQPLIDDAQKRGQDAAAKAREAYDDATATYRRLTAVSPTDAELWYLLALSGESAGDTKTAITGYERFLKLSPDAAEASYVKAKIKSLKQQQAISSGGGVTTSNR